MEFEYALLMFFSGVLAHAFFIRVLGIWNKALLYKMTFINCLVILRMCENTSKQIIKAAEPTEDKTIEIIFEHWHKMALHSLKNVIPDAVWRQISIDDWDQAMKILSNIEKGIEEYDELR